MVQEAPTSADALRLAGLDWDVSLKEVSVGGIVVPNWKATVRSTDNRVYGMVSDKYKVVQNTDAFAFTDELLKNDEVPVQYETAGALNHGSRVWMLARLPEKLVLGDKVENFLVFSNSHDGTGAVRVAMTPVRVVCQNTLSIALKGAKRQWSTKHMGDMDAKMEDARTTLQLATEYMDRFAEEADILAQTHVSDSRFSEITNALFPIPEDDVVSDRKYNNAMLVNAQFQKCYQTTGDLSRFRGTAWGVLNAVSDFVSHTEPLRNTLTYKQNLFSNVVDGHKTIDSAYALLKKG
jgi:phage/plasmid-like protein (TIGR03299 family)